MSDPVPPFLAALELDADADERAIRRAYARRLKRIDPESDPAGFQALRETFEAALAWVAQPAARRPRITPPDAGGRPPATPPAPPAPVASDTAQGIDGMPATTGTFSWSTDDAKGAPPQAHAARRTAPAPAPAPAPRPAPASARADAREAAPAATPRPPARPPAAARVPQRDPADAVFAEFADRFTRTASDEADAARLLREALADARLVNLEARTSFEGRVAHLLAGGWQPGHEWLFQPACDAFEWETDRRRLDTFGPAGALLDAAVRERLIFFAQPAVVFEAQKSLIRRLRTERPTDARTLAPEMARLGLLMQRFPGWMTVMTRREVVQHWFDTWSDLPEAQRAAAREQSAASPERAPAAAGPSARALAGARPAARPSAPPARAARTPTRPPPLPPVQPYAPPPPRPAFGGFGGSVRSTWLVVAFIVGVLRAFGSLDATPHPAPAPAPPLPTIDSEALAAPAPPSPAQAIRDLAARGTPSAPDDSPMYGDGTATNPNDTARQQRRQDALARRQAQIDERYQEILRSQQGKQAIREPAEGR